MITPPGKSSVHRKLLCGALAGASDVETLYDHLADGAFARIDITNPDLSIRCVAAEDASDGDERAWLQVQWRLGSPRKHHPNRGRKRALQRALAQSMYVVALRHGQMLDTHEKCAALQ